MQNQYLIVAENIIYKNNKLSCINIHDQFLSVQLPAEFTIDLAVICGPGWEAGSHNIEIKAKTDETEIVNVGNINIEIPGENFVYNAIAPNLKLALGEGVKNITFVVYKNNEVIIERTYPINSLFNRAKVEQPVQQTEPETAQ